MQKNVFTVVAVAGSCAVLYILYRLKIFSEKNCSIEAKDKNMGKSKLNGTRENIVYGNTRVTKSSLDIKSEDVKYNSNSKSVKKSNAIQLQNVSTSQSELAEYGSDGSIGTTTIYPINFDIKNSNAESCESINNLSNGGISSPMPSLQILNNSLDEREIYDADNEVKYLNLDVNENRSPEDRFDYYIKSNDVDIPNKNSVDSSSSCSNLSISPEFTNSIGDKIQHKAPFQINEINSENLNLDIPESLSRCIVDAVEHLNISNLECDYNVPNSGAEELNAEEISKPFLSNIEETLHSNFKNCDSSSNLELNSLGTADCVEPQSCTENLQDDNHSNVPFVNEIDKVSCTSEIHSAESIECNCDQNLNLGKNLGDLNIEGNDESQMNPSVSSKVKKSRRRKNRSNKPTLTDDSVEVISCSSSQSSHESNAETVNTEGEAKPRNLSETSVDCGQSWTDEHSNGSSVIADNSMADLCFFEFEVPQTLVGRLIGKKGNFLNKVKADTDTKLVVINHEFNKDLKVCCVEGEKSRIFEAIKMIRDHFPSEDFPEMKLDPLKVQNVSLNRGNLDPLKEMTLPFRISTEVEVTFVDSSAVLWLRQNRHQFAREYERLCKNMNFSYGDGSTSLVMPMPIERNAVCVCRLPDGNWARGKVICHANINAKVLLIDSGEVLVIPMINLRPIYNPDFTSTFIQAEKVYLWALKPYEGNEFCNEGLEFLKQLIKGKQLRAVMYAKCSQEPYLPLVKLYAREMNGTEIYVNEMLVQKRFAKVEVGFSL